VTAIMRGASPMRRHLICPELSGQLIYG